MGGVDVADQLRGYYHVRLKCTKNYKYMFWFMFDMATKNSFILYSRFSVSTGTPMTLKQFQVKLVEELIGSYMSRKRAGRPRPPIYKYKYITPSHSKSKRAYCWDVRSQRKETVWFCKDCEGHPSLCLTGREDDSDCFRLWHKQLSTITSTPTLV